MEDKFSLDQLRQAMQQIEAEKLAAEQTNNETEKKIKIDRLIVLLNEIEKELNTIEQTLNKLLIHYSKQNNNSDLLVKISEKLQTVDKLTIKIQKARLNLNWYLL